MKKFKKNIQSYFKKIFQIIFILIYGRVIYQNDSNSSVNIVKRKIEGTISDIKNFAGYCSYKIKNGRIYTNYVEHVAVIDGNNLVNNASFQQVLGELKDAKENIVLKKGTPRIKKKIKGKVLSLIQGASGNENYFHWMCDVLPRLKLCLEHYPLKEIDFFYTPDLKNFHEQTLSVFNIDKNRIINSCTNRHVEASELIIIDHPWYREGFILNQVEYLPSWIIEWLRNIYLDCAEEFDSNDKIYIDRTESKFKHCQIQNDDQIFNFLKQRGFSKYRTGELSIFKQIYLFNKAKTIVGAHGAAFTNLAFCKAGTNIIEIKPFKHPNNVNRRISQINNLNYRLIETKEVDENEKKLGDIYLPIEKLQDCMKGF